MSPRASFVLIMTAGVLASASADAAGLAPNLNIHSAGATNTTALMAGRTGYPSYTPPPAPQFNSNDQFDATANLNPGGGGGGKKPGKKPNLQ